MDLLSSLELTSVICNIVFLILLTKEKKSCWLFGMIGSLLGAYVVYESMYYSETILYLFYALMGLYGYYYWGKQEKENFTIKRSSYGQVLSFLALGVICSLGLGYVMSSTEADKPYYDALSTVFGVLATFLELYKYFISWSFWIAINAYSVWLYGVKELNFFALQMIVFTALSIYGLLTWRAKLASYKA